MDLYTYQLYAQRTMPYGLSFVSKLTMLILGIAGETGEIVDVVKKVEYHGHTYDSLDEEIGDLLWYIANLASLLNFALPDCMPPMDDWHKADMTTLALELADLAGSVARLGLNEDLMNVYRNMEPAARYIGGLVPRFLQVLSTMAALRSMALSAIAGQNIRKLQSRYPDGFSQENSLHRAL